MSEISGLKEAQVHLRAPDWGHERAARVLASVQRHRRRFAISSVALGSAALAVAVAIAIVWFAQGGSAQGGSQAPAPALVDNQIELRDGTRAIALSPASTVKLVGQSEELVSFALESGKGWFEVTPSETRRVEVQVKDVRVVVLGTEFVVEVKGEFVQVWVQRGKVKVVSGAETIVLTRGQEGRFPAHDPPIAPEPPEVDAAPATVAIEAADEANERPPPPEEARDAPPRVTPRPEPVPVESEVSLLWRQADSARLRGDSVRAISALTALLSNHPDDARAALVAFTLGRVLTDSGGSSRTAARAFAKARKLAPEGPLVEDALLREIEAWYAAGDDKRVVSRSNKYLQMFPSGRYRKQIEHMRSQP